jgi:hypothetical protein
VWLLMAIVHWGQFQLQREGKDAEDGLFLRDKILPALHQIKFFQLSSLDFGSRACTFCKMQNVLSKEEQVAIFMAIDLEDFSLLPPNFRRR